MQRSNFHTCRNIFNEGKVTISDKECNDPSPAAPAHKPFETYILDKVFKNYYLHGCLRLCSIHFDIGYAEVENYGLWLFPYEVNMA